MMPDLDSLLDISQRYDEVTSSGEYKSNADGRLPLMLVPNPLG